MFVKYAESGSLQAVRVGVCGGEISVRKRSDPDFQDRAGLGFGGVGVGERVMRIRIRCFPFAISDRNTWLRGYGAVRAEEPADLQSLFLRVSRKPQLISTGGLGCGF